jgi:ketosteroid isomerase-like protein
MIMYGEPTPNEPAPSTKGFLVTPNKQSVETYMDGFRDTDRPRILSCLTDDVEWVLPGMFHTHGIDEFATHIVDEGFRGKPEITVTRLVEEGDVVVAEGTVRAGRSDGGAMNLVFCDVFEMRNAKIRKLTSYLMEIK